MLSGGPFRSGTDLNRARRRGPRPRRRRAPALRWRARRDGAGFRTGALRRLMAGFDHLRGLQKIIRAPALSAKARPDIAGRAQIAITVPPGGDPDADLPRLRRWLTECRRLKCGGRGGIGRGGGGSQGGGVNPALARAIRRCVRLRRARSASCTLSALAVISCISVAEAQTTPSGRPAQENSDSPGTAILEQPDSRAQSAAPERERGISVCLVIRYQS